MSVRMDAGAPLGRRLVVGFLAAAIAVLAFHQVVVLLLGQFGVIPARPYSFAPVAPFGVPAIVNLMFWGGLWGVLFAAIVDRLPRDWPLALKGFVFGLAGPLMANWFIVSLVKVQPVAAGFVPLRMLAGVLIVGAFGIGVALINQALTRALGQRHLA